MKLRDKTDVEIKLENLMNRAMDFEGPMFWTLSTLSTEIWGAGGIATDEQFKAIAKQENLISKKEQDALAAQDNQASSSAGCEAPGAEQAVAVSPNPVPSIKRVAINYKAQESLEKLGKTISFQVYDLMQGQGIGSISEFKQSV